MPQRAGQLGCVWTTAIMVVVVLGGCATPPLAKPGAKQTTPFKKAGNQAPPNAPESVGPNTNAAVALVSATSRRTATNRVEPIPSTAGDAQAASDKAVSPVSMRRQDRSLNQRAQLVIPPGPWRMSLLDAIETSLAQNPDLVALRQTENVSRAAVGVARAYPINPYVQIQVTPLEHAQAAAVGAAPSTFNYVLLMHTMELAHQRRYREQAGVADRSRVEWTVHQAELLNVAQTQRLFFTALYMKGLRDVAASAASLNEQIFDAMQKRLAEGTATEADVAIARLDRQSTRRQADLAEANYQTALLDLRRQLNLPAGTQLDLPSDIAAWRWLPATPENLLRARDPSSRGMAKTNDDVAATLVSVRPDVLAARYDVVFGRANVSLANAMRTPNLQIGPYYQRDDFATTYWGFRSQFDVPVLNGGRPMLRQREAELRQRQVAQQQIENRARREAETAIERYERARLLVEQTGAELTGTLPEELKHLEEEFQRGEVDLLRIVQARTSLIQVRRTYLDTLNELALAAANLTAATGLPPTAMVVQGVPMQRLPPPEIALPVPPQPLPPRPADDVQP